MIQEKFLKTILGPYVTNKTYDISSKISCVVFKVVLNSSKFEIKKAVESLFEVKVASVRTVLVKGKVRKRGRIEGRTKSWKKAYVRLHEGHEINFTGAE